MSACRFLASDAPLPEYAPTQDYPISIDIDTGVIDDGGTDDNYFLLPFPEVEDYTPRNYGVALEWRYTEGRAKQIIAYIKAALEQARQKLPRPPLFLLSDRSQINVYRSTHFRCCGCFSSVKWYRSPPESQCRG